MSYKELAHSLTDQIPESKMYYIVTYLQGAAVPEETPNAETIAAMEETCINPFRKFSAVKSQPRQKLNFLIWTRLWMFRQPDKV